MFDPPKHGPIRGKSMDNDPPKSWYRIAVFGIFVGIIAFGAWYVFLRSSGVDSSLLVLQGNVEIRDVDLSFRVPGRIASLKVDEGDKVRDGQALATLDTDYLTDERDLASARMAAQTALVRKLENGSRPQEIGQARAALAGAQATLVNARSTLQRLEPLADKGAVAHQQHENAQAAVSEAEARVNNAQEGLNLALAGSRSEDVVAAKAQLDALKVGLATAERRLSDAELKAPSSGVVITRAREAGSNMAAGETVVVLSLDKPVWVRSYVAEPDLERVRPGSVATIQTDGGVTYRGQVGFVSPVAEFTPRAVETRELRTSLVYRIRITVDDTNGQLRQGMPVTVTIASTGAK
jgi:HlyD family secretion protein